MLLLVKQKDSESEFGPHQDNFQNLKGCLLSSDTAVITFYSWIFDQFLSSRSLYVVICRLSSVTFQRGALLRGLKFSAMFLRHLVTWPSVSFR